nr:hypothetical protein CFP56_21308 [Quercus suber]
MHKTSPSRKFRDRFRDAGGGALHRSNSYRRYSYRSSRKSWLWIASTEVYHQVQHVDIGISCRAQNRVLRLTKP